MFEWLKVGVTNAVSAELAASLKFETLRDEVCDQIIYRLTAQVLADQLPPERVERSSSATFDVPASWWQAWKAEHPGLWRGWLRRRWPALTAEHTRTMTLSVDLRRYRVYPEQTAVLPQYFGRPVLVATSDTSVRWVP